MREELVMNLIQAEENTPALVEWAQRLGIDLNQPRVAAVVEVDSGQLGVDSAMAELQQLQNALTTPERNNLIAIVSLTEMVVLKPALNSFGRWDAEDHRKRVEQLISRMKENGQLRFRVALGNYFTAGQYCTFIPHGAHYDDGRQTADARKPQLFLSGFDAAGSVR